MSYSFIDIIFAVAALLICIYSYQRGFLKRLSSLIAAIVSVIALSFLNSYLKQFHFSKDIYQFAILIGAFVIVFVVMKMIVSVIAKDIHDTPVLGTADKFLGLISGILQSVIYISIAGILLYYVAREIALRSAVISFVIQFFNIT